MICRNTLQEQGQEQEKEQEQEEAGSTIRNTNSTCKI